MKGDNLLEKNFLERYKALNPEQKLAVDSIDGPVLVIAGPGTGKTEILTLRIANILRITDTQPENILALTFTDAASGNMRKRLSNLIGARAYRVAIETFHSFCNSIIKDYPEYFPTIIGSGNITEVESVAILEELIKKEELEILRPWGDPLFYIRDIYRKIEELKREAVSPKKFEKLVSIEKKKFEKRNDLHHEKGAHKGKMKGEYRDFQRLLQKNIELGILYSSYQEVLKKRRLYDWSDMIMEVLSALEKHNNLKLSLQESHQYILVDEHQDTNNAQNKILEILCDFHKNPNIFIVGDEKQAIFRFQGASIENFNYFKTIYPNYKLINLFRNYRSGQNILDAAHSLIASPKSLLSHKESDSGINIAEFRNKNSEMYFVVKKIKEIISTRKTLPKEVAVIYRTNKEAFLIAEFLEKNKIKYSIESDEDLLSERFVKKFLSILECIYRYGEDEFLIPILHIEELSVDILDAYRLIAKSSKSKIPLYDLIQESKIKSLQDINQKLKIWARQSNSDQMSEFLERILRESGLLSSMISSRDADAFLGIDKLFEEGKRIGTNRPGAKLTDFMEFIKIIKERNLFIKRPKHNLDRNSVRLMTAHRSKGLEFEYVFIINATEKSFGQKSDRDSLKLVPSVYNLKEKEDVSIDILSDERRLFYVALTRAKKEVMISYTTNDESGKEILPSPFIIEIRDDRKKIVETEGFEKELLNDRKTLFSERVKTSAKEIDREFVSELFHSHPMSVTALNNYLTCPWKYFYKNLLRIPSAPEKHQIYGIAMHGAVEDLWRVMKERGTDRNFLLNSYTRHLGDLGILGKSERKEAENKGTRALSGWFDWSKPKLIYPVITEFSIKGVSLSSGVVISGKLDKVDVVSDKKVIVTDYKTGRIKSRNFIEGKTKDSTGDILRQLIFYKLLLKLHDDIDMTKGVIEFLEPNDSGKYSREEFEINMEEVDELKETINRVSKEILGLDFWNKNCGEKDCQYCSYRKLIEAS